MNLQCRIIANFVEMFSSNFGEMFGNSVFCLDVHPMFSNSFVEMFIINLRTYSAELVPLIQISFGIPINSVIIS